MTCCCEPTSSLILSRLSPISLRTHECTTGQTSEIQHQRFIGFPFDNKQGGKCILRNFGRPGIRNIYSRVLHQVLWDKLFCGDGSYAAASAKTKTTARKPSNETYLTYIETFKIQPTSSEARTISMLPLLRKDLYVITFFPILATLLLPSVQIRLGDNKFRLDYWSKMKPNTE